MNVLVLTPDAVGSTLLQRLITIYMQFHRYDRPVINLHELTNGLIKYYNPVFQQEVLGKKEGAWGYYQSLEQVVQLLQSVDHYKTSRLAHYHIRNRQDAIQDQLPFYQYLNENFYIISCRRHNVFEHALSWCLSKITKKLNVYNGQEKINSFFDLYKNGIDIDPNSLIQTLNSYKDYLSWCNNHFNVANYFYYDEHLANIEKYVLSLPIFGQQTRLTWKDNFDVDFDIWNRCHYMDSDLGTLALDSPKKFAELSDKSALIDQSHQEMNFLLSYQKVADPSWPKVKSIQEYQSLPDNIKREVEKIHGINYKVVAHQSTVKDFLPASHQNFLNEHKQTYQNSLTKIHGMIDSGVLVSSPPIKKQTLAEKKHMIKNYKHLLQVYNHWIQANPDVGLPLDESVLDQFAQSERQRWSPASQEILLCNQQKTS